MRELQEFDELIEFVEKSEVAQRICDCVDKNSDDESVVMLLHFLEIHPEEVKELFKSLSKKHEDDEERLRIVELVKKDLEEYEEKFEMHFKRLNLLKAILERG